MGVHDNTVNLLARQKRLEDKYKALTCCLKINKSDMAGKMEVIAEYLRSCQCVMRASLAYIIRKNITVETYGDYAKYETPDITKMLHLPQDKNELLPKKDPQSGQAHAAEYGIDSRTI